MHALRNAYVLHWAKINGIEPKNLYRGRNLIRLLSEATSSEVSLALQSIESSVTAMSIKELEGVFESLLEQDRRQTYGAVYTPEFIISYLLSEAIEMSWQDRNRLPRILDPFCGCAGFLIGGAEVLKRKYGVSYEQAFTECLTGADIDPLALHYAGCLIELFLASKGQDLPGPNLQLFEMDTLSIKPMELREATFAPNGFDIIGTNPPYVKLQNLKPTYRRQLSESYSEFATGSYSLAILFLIAGHRLLSSNGTMAIITQNNLFSSLAGKQIRQYLQDQKCVRRIIDFGHRQIFKGASAYTCLVFLSASKRDAIEYESLADRQVIDSEALANADFSLIEIKHLRSDKWRLAKKNHLRNLWKIEATGAPLGEVAQIKVGFATLKDSVFLALLDGEFCKVREPDGTEHVIEPEITRPAVKVSDLSSADDLRCNNLRVLFPYQKTNGRYKLIAENDLQRNFPLAYAYLLSKRDVLIQRDKGDKKYEGWYAWGRTQGMAAPGPKLLTKTFSRSPQFILDPSDQLFCNGYGLFQKEHGLFGESIRFDVLQRILSSRIMHYYAKLTSFQIEGDYQCYQKNFIERFGIPNLAHDEMEILLQMNTDQVDYYLAHIYEIPWNDILEIVASD